jgi:hypothetical protein
MIRALALAAFATAIPLSFSLAQNGSVRNSRIIGVVADSVDGTPLQGAEVIVSGVATTVRTDSLGRFTIDSLPPGTYQVGVFHPLLESLGITLATKPFVIGPDSAGVVMCHPFRRSCIAIAGANKSRPHPPRSPEECSIRTTTSRSRAPGFPSHGPTCG